LGIPVATLAAFVVSHQTFGTPSAAALAAGLAGLACYFPGLLVLGFRSGRLTGFGGKLALAGVSTFTALLVAVLILAGMRGEFFRDPADRTSNLEPHPTLGHAPTMTPGAQAAGLKLEDTVGQNLETVDPDRRQVVVIGDSVLYGWGVRKEESAVSILAASVQDRQVMNFSVSGYSPTQYLLYLREHLGKTRPDVVVVGIYSGNDYASSGVTNWNGHATVMFVPDGDGLKLWREHTPRFNCIDFLSSSVLFYRFLWTWPDFAGGLLDGLCNAPHLDEPVLEEVVRRILRQTEELVRSHGARLLYVLLPDANDFQPEGRYVRELSKYRNLEKLLKEGGYDVLWFFDEIRASGIPAEDLYIPGDSAHFNVAGNRLLAETLRLRLARDHGIR
jgi:lysophospholipase L1-like esterase